MSIDGRLFLLAVTVAYCSWALSMLPYPKISHRTRNILDIISLFSIIVAGVIIAGLIL